MRRKTLDLAIQHALSEARAIHRTDQSLDRFERMHERIETVHVVKLADYATTKERFDKLERTGEIQRAEIAQLRMLLREAHGQLERLHTTTKTTGADYRRLTNRIEQALGHTTTFDAGSGAGA